MRLPVICFLIGLFALTGNISGQPITKKLHDIEPLMKKILADYHGAGMAVAVVEKNKLVYSQGFGYRNMEAKKEVNPNTLFPIGSCTKAFTSSILGMLEAENKLSIDHPATEYLPSLKFYNDEMNARITVRDLMCHRTGLSRFDVSWYMFKTDSRDSLLQRVAYMKPNAGIRDRWQYNNFMFMVQGMIAEKITGKTWEANLKDRILQPLNMNRTSTSIAEMLKDTNVAAGYTVENDSSIIARDYFEIRGIGPAGSINSSVNELAPWVSAWVMNGKFQGKQIIPPAYRTKAISSQMVVDAGLPGEQKDVTFLNYGLGWFLRSYRGHYKVEHGGNIDGFSSMISFYPADSIGIIVLTNQDNSGLPMMVTNMFADRLLGLKTIDWNKKKNKDKRKDSTSKAEPISGRVRGTRPSHELSAYQGNFTNPAYGQVSTVLRNDSLFGFFGDQKVWLTHYHYDVFEAKRIHPKKGIDTASSELNFNFRFGENGKLESVVLPIEQGANPKVEFKYTTRAEKLSKADLERYAGIYALEGVESKLSVRDSSIFLVVTGQPEYELVPLGNHAFDIKNLPGFQINFEMGKENRAIAFLFTRPNGTSFRLKKKSDRP